MDEWLFRRLDTDRADFEREFHETNGYPLPWCEIVDVEEVEALSWKIGQRVGMGRPTITIEDTLDYLWRQLPGKHQSDDGQFWGDTEPIDDAVKRLSVPSDGVVVVLSFSRRADRGDGPRGLRIRMKSVIEGHFWRDDTFVVDAEANWALCGIHDRPAYFWQFPRPTRST
ncbi:hypothetical protein AY599_25920 [Leptolyngbya valderiana BDU 20041]|nr:hypothetical protein AY599_25920 [Leptolyngbya valderiana BDU 20041]